MTTINTEDWLESGPATGSATVDGAAALGVPRARHVARARRMTARERLIRLARHGEVRRVIAFLFAGGLSALVTLSVTSGLNEFVHVPFFWSAVAGTELGILVNFALNDRRTFEDLAGHRRALPVRLLRYHLTSAVGQTTILLASLMLHDVAHWRALFAQALPIALATGINFLMHRFWTYRPGRHVPVR